MIRWLVLLLILVGSTPILVAEEWQRVLLIDDPKITVTLVLRKTASPADEEWVGFELNNRTEGPLEIRHGHYRLDVNVSDRASKRPMFRTSMASGNDYDLLWREGDRRPPQIGPRNIIPVGITRSTKFISIKSLLGWPDKEGYSVTGRAHFRLNLSDGLELETPTAGVPYSFCWVPPDEQGVEILRGRLKRVLAKPADPFGDAYLLEELLSREEIASAISVKDLLAGARANENTLTQPVILKHIGQHFPTDEAVIAFWLEKIRSHDLDEICRIETVRDARLIDPLMGNVRGDPLWAGHALEMLKNHRNLMSDPRKVASELGQIMLSRTKFLSSGTFPDTKEKNAWSVEVAELSQTGDTTMVVHLVPYLDRKDVVLNLELLAEINNGVPTRACDKAYNAILELLDRPDGRFSHTEWLPSQPIRLDPKEEYARRDALIARLKAELTTTK